MTTKTLFHTSIAVFVLGVYALVTTPEAKAAASCEITVEATDAMAFSTKQIDIAKTCKEFTLNLKHIGKLGKNVMGHNIVIAKATDQQGVLDDGGKAGAASDFVKAKDARVIAATKIIGSGETTSVKFSSSKLDAKESYVFFCSFPGHAFMMKGVVKLI